MQLIKEYLYETILVAVTLVLAGGIWYYNSTLEEAKQEALAKTQSVGQRLRSLRTDPVSRDEFQRRRQWIAAIRKGGKDVVEKALQRNAAYPVLPVPNAPRTASAPMFPWFPHTGPEHTNRDDRARDVLTDAFAALDADLNVTRRPDPETVQTEYQRRYRKYMLEQQRLRRKLQGEEGDGERFDGPGGPGGLGGPGGWNEDAGPMNLGPMPATGAEQPVVGDGQSPLLTEQQVKAKAQADAVKRYVLESARSGLMYLDEDAFQRSKTQAFQRGLGSWSTDRQSTGSGVRTVETLVNQEEIVARLFEDHVRYWVITDILDAIKLTNEESLKRGGKRLPATVPNAAIKRLVWIDCDGKFFIGQSEGRQEQIDGMGMDEEFETGRRRSGPGRGPSEIPPAKNLTTEVSSQRVDIVHYTIYMVMDTEYLGLFQRILAQKNYHTPLAIEKQEVLNPLASFHYYGAKPVMLVRFQGQLRLLSDLTRGKAKDNARPSSRTGRGRDDAKPNPLDWFVEAYPPLAPLGVLKRPGYAPALRKVDQARLPAKQTGTGSRRRR